MQWIRFAWQLLVVSAFISLIGCGHIFKPPADDTRARMVLSRLLERNHALARFKGLAQAQMQAGGRTQSGRIAFAAIWPDRMRVELLNTMGGALTSLIGDGRYISIRTHGDQKQYRIRQSRTALEPIVHLPIGIEDLQSLLAGRVPLPPHAFVRSGEAQGAEEIILLKNRWHGSVARIEVATESQKPRNMRVYNSDGQLKYQIDWAQWQEVEGFELPKEVVIASSGSHRLILRLDRFWPNPELPASTFDLEPATQ